MRYRKERDLLGSVRLPADAYYGSETQRAVENFPISGMRLQKEFLSAYFMLKKAAAKANMRAGKLDSRKGKAIIAACDELLADKLADQFVVDLFQAGAGTSTNMNVNEVIANMSIVKLGGRKGDYSVVHPNDHVNMSQSTNDTFHSVLHVAAYLMLRDRLEPAVEALRASLESKAREYIRVVKIGRTHLQDAVPITVGQEFSAHAHSMRVAGERIGLAMRELAHIPLGGTAVGTGMNAPEGYKKFVVRELSRLTGIKLKSPRSLFFEMQDQTTEAFVASVLKTLAISLNKIANDLRLLGSGPRAGIGELTLPTVQPGSSIMPGKINPSIAEMLNMVCFQVMGNAAAVTEAANAGQLELNVFMPVIAYNILFSIGILSNAIVVFDRRCVRGIEVNKEAISKMLSNNLALATALSPYIGYSRASQIAKKAYKEGKSIKEVCLELGILDKKSLDEILEPKRLV
jgi:fumarate hydratase class II